jgi:hypothetical protein
MEVITDSENYQAEIGNAEEKEARKSNPIARCLCKENQGET